MQRQGEMVLVQVIVKPNTILRTFGINLNQQQKIKSLYDYAPVYRFHYAGKDFVLKRTGVRSEAKEIANWTNYLVAQGIKSVAPVKNFGQNPRCLKGKNNTEENWVIYPFITGIPYRGNETQIYSAGKLLGQIHAVGMKTNFNLKISSTIVEIKADKIESEIEATCKKVEQYAVEKLELVRDYSALNGRTHAANRTAFVL